MKLQVLGKLLVFQYCLFGDFFDTDTLEPEIESRVNSLLVGSSDDFFETVIEPVSPLVHLVRPVLVVGHEHHACTLAQDSKCSFLPVVHALECSLLLVMPQLCRLWHNITIQLLLEQLQLHLLLVNPHLVEALLEESAPTLLHNAVRERLSILQVLFLPLLIFPGFEEHG